MCVHNILKVATVPRLISLIPIQVSMNTHECLSSVSFTASARATQVMIHDSYAQAARPHTALASHALMVIVRNAIKRVFYGLAGERSRLMNWPDPSPARSLSLVVG